MEKGIRLPIRYITENSRDEEDCEECLKRAEDLGMSAKDLCADCLGEEEVELTLSYETLDVLDIKSYNPLEEGMSVRICFYSSANCAKYEISEKEFVNLLERAGVELISYKPKA